MCQFRLYCEVKQYRELKHACDPCMLDCYQAISDFSKSYPHWNGQQKKKKHTIEAYGIGLGVPNHPNPIIENVNKYQGKRHAGYVSVQRTTLQKGAQLQLLAKKMQEHTRTACPSYLSQCKRIFGDIFVTSRSIKLKLTSSNERGEFGLD